jgi:tRNA-specific 2-thiouridylase
MNEMKRQTVVVAMSGGVDSSVAAALLLEQGYRVIGVMLRLWSEPGREDSNRCCTPDAMAQARRVAAKLGFPFYPLDARQAFKSQVVSYFLDGYTQGDTPNPCLVCNRHIRWGMLLNYALSLGADFMATGHYARLRQDETGKVQLLRGLDPGKDQSYVLHVLQQEQLQQAMFPVGNYTKAEVRQIAQRFGLAVAQRPDSQDLCFLAGDDYREFLLRNQPQVLSPGPIITRQGELLGEHRGLAFYTIGQRKGLGIAAPEPLYVLDKDTSRNALIVGEQNELGRTELLAGEVNWLDGSPPTEVIRANVKIRYKAADAPAEVLPLSGNRAAVRFQQPLRDITPGQAAVFYQGERCLGGGIIQSIRSEGQV